MSPNMAVSDRMQTKAGEDTECMKAGYNISDVWEFGNISVKSYGVVYVLLSLSQPEPILLPADIWNL